MTKMNNTWKTKERDLKSRAFRSKKGHILWLSKVPPLVAMKNPDLLGKEEGTFKGCLRSYSHFAKEKLLSL